MRTTINSLAVMGRFISHRFLPVSTVAAATNLAATRPYATTPPASTTACSTSSTISSRSSSSSDVNETIPVLSPPPILLLEGDCLQVSNQGVARTYYHLLLSPDHDHHHHLGIEERYHLATASKTFVLRQQTASTHRFSNRPHESMREFGDAASSSAVATTTLAPLGPQILSQMQIQEIHKDDVSPGSVALGTSTAAGTGATTWESSLAMALYFGQPLLENGVASMGDVLEIGAGVGVGAILLSHIAHHQQNCNVWRHDPFRGSFPSWSSITLTDGNDICLQQCQTNVLQAWPLTKTAFPPDVQVSKLDWNEDGNPNQPHQVQQYDTILACDVCYVYDDTEALVRTIQRRLRRPHGIAHFFGPYNRGAFQHLIQQFQQQENMLVTVEPLHFQRYRLQPHNRPNNDNGVTWSQQQQQQPQWSFPSSTSLSSFKEDCRYVSKSQATILHVTVRHRPQDESSTTTTSNTVPPLVPSSGDIRDLD